jgi:tRNA threonylcarbamoyladenosine biosynthesis protein TsaB
MAPPARRPPSPPPALVLGLETGGDHLSVALVSAPASGPPVLLEARTSHRGHRHADVLLAHADAMLTAHGAGPRDLALVAVGRGPGGFTGVRVGLATALGLSLGAGVPVWPVCSLTSLAASAAGPLAGSEVLLATALDARRGEVYAALFTPPDDSDGVPCPVLPPRAEPLSAFQAAAEAAARGRRIVWLGSGAMAAGLVPGAAAGDPLHLGSAVHHARLATLAWRADPKGAAPVDPAYLRKSEAEINADRAAEKALEKARALRH